MPTWKIRTTEEAIDIQHIYDGQRTSFSILLHHGGKFTEFPNRRYIEGKQVFVDLVDMKTFSVHEINDMMDQLGYVRKGIVEVMFYHFLRPGGDLDFNLFALDCDDDVRRLTTYVSQHKLIDVYTEHGNLEAPPVVEHENFTTPPNVVNDAENVTLPPVIEHASENDGTGADDNESYESDSEDSDFFVDEDNLIDDVEVDMKNYHLNIDLDVEWIGGASKPKVSEPIQEEEDLEVLDNDVFLTESSSDDEGIEGRRKKAIKAIRRAHENDNAVVSEPFYVHQKFNSSKEFKDKVNMHAIETRRELYFEKNDGNRVRVLCKGTVQMLGSMGLSGTGQQVNEEVNEELENGCPWLLYCSNWKKDKAWSVKRYDKEHLCLQSRKIKQCDYKYLSKQITQQVEADPRVPIRALRQQLQRENKVDISKMKAFRAREEALKQIRGDYENQYTLLRDYLLEVQTKNPDTTIKLDVEIEGNPTSDTRTFKRVYVCLGALKKGFAAGRRDFVGLDGAFMKGPYPGQILSAVALDGNNGIYPLAYSVVEAETYDSWTWFLSNLGDDLGLTTMSNFTFITDRQKGVLPAIRDLFPCAENRYCLRHLQVNIRSRWKGPEFKNILWKCATTCNVQEFRNGMEELRKLNNVCYEYLKDIPAKSWARSHFTGRAHSDTLLNNLCESFNSKLEDGRDTPIITCLEFIREYIMRKIVTVDKAIEKAKGPLTPTAMKKLEAIKNEAVEYVATFCGDGKYQVSNGTVDQCVVNVGQQLCSCKKWELTGIPCKHAIAAIWDMRQNNIRVGTPETFFHQCYWLTTWKQMYSFKVDPINGRTMWVKSACPTTLLPPKYRVPIGRPKKKRKRSALEKEDLVKGNKASRAYKTVRCTKCNNTGHNARTCKGQRPNVEKSKGNGKEKGKGNGTEKGKGKGNGTEKGKGKGNGTEKGKGNGKGKGNLNGKRNVNGKGNGKAKDKAVV